MAVSMNAVLAITLTLFTSVARAELVDDDVVPAQDAADSVSVEDDAPLPPESGEPDQDAEATPCAADSGFEGQRVRDMSLDELADALECRIYERMKEREEIVREMSDEDLPPDPGLPQPEPSEPADLE